MDIRPFDERPIFGYETPDPAVDLVAQRVVENDFSVVDDRVVPINDVKRAVGSYFEIDRRNVWRLDRTSVSTSSAAYPLPVSVIL